MMNLEKIKPAKNLELIFQENGFQRKFRANEMIFMENDRDDCLYYIANGMVKLSMLSNDGKEKTLFILRDSQFFGEVSLVDGLEYCVNAETLTNTVIYSMNYKDIKEILAREPEIAFDLLQIMAEKMRFLTQQIKDIIFYDIAGRMASQILIFMKKFGVKTKKGVLIDLSLTHQELANLLGASRVTVTKTLNNFQEEQIIEIVNKKILIIDQVRLNKFIS